MRSVTSDRVTDWKAKYRAAMQETDRTRLPQKLSEAEDAVLNHVRELFYTSHNREEKDELKIAFHTLQTLRHGSEHIEKAA